MKRVAIYLRVSTTGQTLENQRLDLEAVAKASGWEIVGVYEDHGISGAKGRDKRPGFDRMLKDATARKFDVLAAWSLDRLGRSMGDLVRLCEDLQALGRDLYLHKERIDTTTSAGRLMFNIIGSFAEFERERIRERIKAGVDRARKQGAIFGRPRTDRSIEERIRKALAKGKGKRKLAQELGVGVSVVMRVAAEAPSRPA